MYSYSPISKLRVKNFRNIGDVELDFTESPIVTLVGNNEAGKTSIIKAFSACALHASPREQKEWIRDTTKMFGVQIDLADGTQIVRVKEDKGVNLYKIIYPDGKTWDIDKLTDGLPSQVQQLMGLIAEAETGEFLHIRTYEDKLLFVVTPDSVNYKVMYNALKVEQLTKAIKIGSNEVNALKSEVNRNENSLQTLGEQLRDITVLDIEDLKTIRERLKYQLNLLDKIEKAVTIVNNIKAYEASLGPIGLLDRFNLQPIDEILASDLTRVNNSLENINKLNKTESVLKQLDTACEVDLSVLQKLNDLINRKNEIIAKQTEAGAFIHIDKTEMINETLFMQLSKAKSISDNKHNLELQAKVIDTTQCAEVTDSSISSLQKASQVIQMISNSKILESDLGKINTYLDQVQEYLKSLGVAVESCPKCGEAVVFDIDKLEGKI